MRTQLPTIATGNLPSPPPPGSIQFFDGYFPALYPGTYSINVEHTMSGPAGMPPPFSLPAQSFTVQAPEFFIDTTIVETIYPPAGGSDIYGQQLPFLVMSDPSLPWERSLIPGTDAPSPTNPTPWMALLIFAEGEIQLPPSSNNPVTTGTVADFLAPSTTVLKPQLPDGWVSSDLLSSQCQTITIPGAVFNAVVPSTDDLPYLAHCRALNTLDEGEELLSVLLSNRLAVANSTVTPQAPLRYYAHLVSLEGFEPYMGPNAQPIPTQPGSTELMDVQLASLFNWTFVSQPQTDLGFEELVAGLIQSEQSESTEPVGQGALGLPATITALPSEVQERLDNGYVALELVSGSGDDSFAWYRGPFTATVPQPLPGVGDAQVPVAQAATADALMIYLAEQGLFDLSYAAAWNIGRELALANASFAQNVGSYRQSANGLMNALAQRMAMPHLASETDPRSLLARDASRRSFARMMGQGLGKQWTAALAATRTTAAPAPASVRRMRRSRSRSALHPREMLAMNGVVDAIAENLGEAIDSVAGWLASLSLLYPVPFSYLVPDPRMLPVESIRFFYVDSDWIDALTAGALSIAIQSSQDVMVQTALFPHIQSAVARKRRDLMHRARPDALPNVGGAMAMSGMLIRSQLVSGWPQLLVTASLGGAPLNLVRNDCPSPNVRLVIFDGVPDTVTLAEPYKGVLFGVEDLGIYPRCVTNTALTGAIIANAAQVQPSFRTPASGSIGGVLDVQSVAASLEPAVGITPFAADAVVQWNGSPLATTFVSGIQLTAIVPASLVTAPGSAAVTVTSGGATSLPATFTVNAALEIDGINPTMMLAGAEEFTLSLSGTGFAPDAVVQWNGTALATTVISTAEATATVPADLAASIGSATITVLSGGAPSNGVTLAIVGGDPAIDTLAPNIAMAGGAGFALTVSGSGFDSSAIVQWNGAALPTAFVNDQTLTAAVAADLIASTGSASVIVMVNGTASAPAAFTITGAEPTIGSLQPAVAMAGGAGFQLTIDGVSFSSSATVQWNGTALATTFGDAGQLTATVPASLLTAAGVAQVTVADGTTSNALPFTVIGPQPAIGLLEPASIVAGAQQFVLTITGGFGAGDFALQMVAAPELQSFTTA
jgi:hypothetical protein